jgi:hypothetical protein
VTTRSTTVADSNANQTTMIHVTNDDEGRVILRVTASGQITEAYLNPPEVRAVADMLDRHGRMADEKAPATTSFIGSSPGPVTDEPESAGLVEAIPLQERT